MSDKQGEKKELPYAMKGIPIRCYLTESGDFQWIPDAAACNTKEHALEIPEVLAKIKEPKRQVWIPRFDHEKAIGICPIIIKDQQVKRAFDELFNPQYSPKLRSPKELPRGEGEK